MPARGSSLLSFFFTFAALALASTAQSDTLLLEDGSRVHGRLVSVTRGWVEFQPLEGDDLAEPMRVAVAEVRSIQFGDDADASDLAVGSRGRRGGRLDPGDPGVTRARGGRRRDQDRPGGVRDGRETTFGREDDSESVGDGSVDDAERPLGRREGVQGTPARRDDRRRGRMITVSARQRWTDSGIDVVAGDVISFSIAGTVTLGDDHPLGAEGDLDGATAAPRRPLTDRPAGALIGRIGTSPDDTFFIGAERLPFRVRTSGRLYLGVNDDTLDDDGGAFQVAVTRSAP
jgi:hypothetical protein